MGGTMKAHRITVWWRTLVIVSFLTTMTICIMGTQEALASNFAKKSLRPGSWSLQFGVLGDYQLKSYGGLMFSLKRHYSNRSAIRVGLDFRVTSKDTDIHRDSEYDDDLCYYRVEDGDGFTAFGVTAQYLFYPSPTKSANLFLGIGPSISYSRNKSDFDSWDSCTEDSVRDSRWTNTYSLHSGIRGTLGFEWFVADNVGLLAEYGARLIYVYTQNETGSQRATSIRREIHDKRISREVVFSYDAVRVGLSVYF